LTLFYTKEYKYPVKLSVTKMANIEQIIILAHRDLLTIKELSIWMGKGWGEKTIYAKYLPREDIWKNPEKLKKFEEKKGVWIMGKHYFRVGSQFRVSKSAVEAWIKAEG